MKNAHAAPRVARITRVFGQLHQAAYPITRHLYQELSL